MAITREELEAEAEANGFAMCRDISCPVRAPHYHLRQHDQAPPARPQEAVPTDGGNRVAMTADGMLVY